MFEVEKRSLFKSKKKFEEFERYISKNAKFIDEYTYKSFLFKKPQFIRIRITAGKNKVEITKKEGDYNSPTRKEINKYIDKKDLFEYIKKLKTEGFKKCVSVKTKSRLYKIKNITIALNTITNLGMIVEIEGLTNKKSKVPEIEKKVSNIIDELNLKELNPKIYQKMMNRLYLKTKNISKQKFTI